MAGNYDARLVILSVMVAILASYTALDLAGRVTQSSGRAARLWLLSGAISMGAGIWSMHFIGMLAFELPIRVAYDIPLTAASLLIAMIVSGFALRTASAPTLTWLQLGRGGILMGAGICMMHYTGMFAMRMSPGIIYRPAVFAASVGIAITASWVALWIAFRLRKSDHHEIGVRFMAAVVMGLAIAGMHYTGMTAAVFAPGSICLAGGTLDSHWLAVTIGSFTVSVLTITLLVSIFDVKLTLRTARIAQKLDLANAELIQLALHDALTKLPNRTLLEDRIEQAISQSRRSTRPFAILFLDLDRFKAVNDSLGHHVGDGLLYEVAGRLKRVVRAQDTVSRIGGDEFVILLGEMSDASDASKVAQKIVEAFAVPFEIDGIRIEITPSIGIGMFPLDGQHTHELIVNADAAMYHAKKSGRNNYQFFSREMNELAVEQLRIHGNLRRALANREFELFYQPKFSARTGLLTGMEALLRWRDPERGLIPPGQFIPVAEESALIIPIGEWVLQEACRQNKAWQDAGFPRLAVAVNLSGSQFRQRNLLEMISATLQDSGLEARFLELELTESVVMDNAQRARVTLEELSAKGVKVAIDDFGTGYSSLSYLKRFPIGTLKIDQSFVRDITISPDDAAIVKAIVGLAHNLRLLVVAEGIETREQLTMLSNLDCDEYQGYLGAKPLPAGEFEHFMKQSMIAPQAVTG